MCLKRPKIPKPDERIGEAAVLQAEVGREYLDFMRTQADTSNAWAQEDRDRYKSVFEPLQDSFIERTQDRIAAGPDYSKVDGDVRRAQADVSTAFDSAQQQQQRGLAARGVRPDAGASVETSRRAEVAEGLASAGAANGTRLQSRARADAELAMEEANAINLGSGLAVNPATSLGLSNNAASSGFSGAQRGYGGMASGLNSQFQNQMQGYGAAAQANSSLWGGLGSLAGLAISMSSKDYKTDKAPVRDPLSQLMDMPVEEWSYKDGIADSGASRHVGPYAEDFNKATGKGDGKTIPLQDMIGVTAGAVQQLADKVDKLTGSVGKQPKSATRMPKSVDAGPPAGRGSLAELLAA
jgi:hypothetical protein